MTAMMQKLFCYGKVYLFAEKHEQIIAEGMMHSCDI
jgi:hypothetical protein